MATTTRTVTLTSLPCANCGVIFAMDIDYERRRLIDRQSFYCLNGHRQWFPGKTAYEERDEAIAQLNRTSADLLRTRTEKQRLADDLLDQVKKVKKIRERARAGLCLKCNRSFQNVKRHNDTKHPRKKASK